MKELEVTCPCCQARLTVDVLTSKVMRTRLPEAEKARDPWAAANEKVRDRTAQTRHLELKTFTHKGLSDLFDMKFRQNIRLATPTFGPRRSVSDAQRLIVGLKTVAKVVERPQRQGSRYASTRVVEPRGQPLCTAPSAPKGARR